MRADLEGENKRLRDRLRLLEEAIAKADMAIRCRLMWAGCFPGDENALAWSVDGVIAALDEAEKKARKP